MEYLSSFKVYSQFDVSYLHVTHGAEIDLDLNQFDAVFHNYCARLCFPGYVSQSYLEALKAFRGVRLLAVQDEYDRTNTLRRAIADIGFHVVFTCVPQRWREFVYPSEMFVDTEFVTVLTGYVPAGLKARGPSRISIAERPILIGYRGRDLRGHYGRLGFDKYEIGRRMREVCIERGIPYDIEMSEKKRIYGDDWYDFVGQCRAMLGTESGSNVFDFDGSLEAKYLELKAISGEDPHYDEFRHYTDPREREIQMGQISPKIFEAAALRTPMVLYTGSYSGIILPGEHYVELKKDFSNVEAVLGQLEDIAALEMLADRTYRHLVGSGSYDYSHFVEIVENAIERHREGRATVRPIGKILSLATRSVAFDAEPTLQEQPTSAPRDTFFFRYRDLNSQHEALKSEFFKETDRLKFQHEALESEFAKETERLTSELYYLRSEFVRETARLIEEGNFLRSEFTSETARLTSETAKLASEINWFQTVPIWHLCFRRSSARVMNIIKAVPPPMLLPLRWIRKNLRRRFRTA